MSSKLDQTKTSTASDRSERAGFGGVLQVKKRGPIKHSPARLAMIALTRHATRTAAGKVVAKYRSSIMSLCGIRRTTNS